MVDVANFNDRTWFDRAGNFHSEALHIVERWEGNTLVVDVRNFTGKTWVVGDLGGEGMHTGSLHSPALHVVERFTIVDADNIDYEATIEDPNVFTRPWKLAFRVFSRAPKDYRLFEYACHEGNRTLDQRTGEVIWQTVLSTQRAAHTSAPPIHYGGLIFIGTAGGDVGARGQIGAYDIKTGKEIWKFYTVCIRRRSWRSTSERAT